MNFDHPVDILNKNWNDYSFDRKTTDDKISNKFGENVPIWRTSYIFIYFIGVSIEKPLYRIFLLGLQ